MAVPQMKRAWGADGLFWDFESDSGFTKPSSFLTISEMSPLSLVVSSRKTSTDRDAGTGPLYSGGMVPPALVGASHLAPRVSENSFGLKGNLSSKIVLS